MRHRLCLLHFHAVSQPDWIAGFPFVDECYIFVLSHFGRHPKRVEKPGEEGGSGEDMIRFVDLRVIATSSSAFRGRNTLITDGRSAHSLHILFWRDAVSKN